MGPDFEVKGEFNGSVLRVRLEQDGWRFASEVVARFLDEKQSVAVGDPSTFNLIRLARRVAMSDVTVILVGPTGTCKKSILALLAQCIKPQARALYFCQLCCSF